MLTVLHFVPYASAEMLRKALLLKADALVLDLEDSVTPDNKDSARTTIVDWLKGVDFGPRERLVRINALDSEWGATDVEATMAGRPDGYLVPKADDVGKLRELDERIRVRAAKRQQRELRPWRRSSGAASCSWKMNFSSP